MSPWAKRTTKTIPSIGSRQSSFEVNDFSKGNNSFVSNDKFPLKPGEANFLRLAQNARITTLGEYETRKGFDFHSDEAGITQDQTITSVTGAADQSFSYTTRKAQKFTTGSGGSLTKVQVNIKNDAAATGHIVVELYTDVSSAPGVLLASTTIDASTLTSSYQYLTARFATAPAVTTATVYWIVVHTAENGTGSYKWSSTTSSTTALTSANSGTTWSSTSYAMNFKQFYSTTAAPKGLYRAYKSDGTKKTLMAHGTVLYSVDDVTGALTTVKSGLNASATEYRFVTVNDIVYYVNGYDGLRKWDFTTESQVNATNYSNICEHKGLLFLVDKTDPNKLVYSNFGDYEVFTSTDLLYIPSPRTGDPISALQPLNGYLLIFTLNNKFILSGDDNATFSLDEAPDQKGTYAQETSCTDKNFVYYVSDDGVYRSNGSEAQLLSENIYQDASTLSSKSTTVICVNQGRLYVWYKGAGSSYNNKCWVWNLNYTSGSDCVESYDTDAYVCRALTAFRDTDEMLVASSIVGQVYWQEKDSNDYNNLGQTIDFILRTHYMVFDSPAVLKEIRYWEPRFSAQTGHYSIDCQYATDLRDNYQTYSSLFVQGSGYEWGDSGTVWGSFTWGSTSEVQGYYYVPGEYRRISLQYSHNAAREPHNFLGHSLVVQKRRLR